MNRDQTTLSADRIDAVFEERMRSLRAYDKRLNTALSDADYLVLKRRKEALLRLIPDMTARFTERFPDRDLPEELLALNAPAAGMTFNELNQTYAVETAAAIRILDALADNGCYEEASAVFPKSAELLNSVDLPNLTDAVHSDDALRAVVYLIRSRNKGAEGYDPGVFFGDAADTGYRMTADADVLPDRAAFDTILSLIGDDVVEAAKQRFTDCLRDVTGRLLDGIPEKEADRDAYFSLIPTAPTADADSDSPYAGIQPPEIRNPYELCFGFLSLLDSGSDFAWLHNICFVTLFYSCLALPWADACAGDEIDVDYEYLSSAIENTPGWDDNSTNELMYRRRLHSPLKTPSQRKISISQLAFLTSGLIPPRMGNAISYTKAILHDSGIPEEQASLLYEYFSLASAVSHRDEGFAADDDGEDEAAQTARDSDGEIKRLRAEVKRLKTAAHRLEQRNKETENRLTEANRRLDAANGELAELRTMIREPNDTEQTAPVTVAFPYSAQKRSVIIGGHDSWVKAIKPLLNNVRFISSSEQPNPGVIMNCEVVWLQTNALGHSGYYKIMDVIRRNRIRVCYFSYASAEKCAEQFALTDMEEPEKTASSE